MAEPPRKTTLELKRDTPTDFHVNRPVKFHLRFAGGTSIDGVIPANTTFSVCDRGDIAEFNIFVDDYSMVSPTLVNGKREKPGPVPGR